MTEEPTVFVVDDDPAARLSVSALVETMGVAVETFASAEDFLESVSHGRSGCVVTDFRMLGISGIALQERLVAQGIRLPVILITAYADVPMAVRAMEGGAVTVLEKPCRDQLLRENILRALKLDADMRDNHQRINEIRRRTASLSPGEREVLDRLVTGKMNKNIAKELDIGLRTVELRRHQIMKKMRVDSVAELVRLVLESQAGEEDKRTAGPENEQ